MEKVRIIDLEQRLFDLGHIDLPGDHLLQDAAVSQVSLQERTDDPAFLMDDLLVDVTFAVGLDFDGPVLGVGVDVAQGHGGDVEKAHGGFAGEEVGHLRLP